MITMFKKFLKEEDGLGIVEIVLILAIIVGIALVFRDKISEFVGRLLSGILGEETNMNTESTKKKIEDVIQNNSNGN